MENGQFIDEMAQGSLGTIAVETGPDSRNLFEKVFVDSKDPEGEIAKIVPNEEIKVFGKIPRRVIQVPTYTGGTTTPDFVYATKNDLFLLVEAKSSSLRDTEKIAVKAQKELFDEFEDVRCSKVTKKEEVLELLKRLMNHNVSDSLDDRGGVKKLL
ncbi:hypothetical protein Hs30E_13690 [Lactococcus hodotermopsidis]|uniref:Type III restriction enzyme C-terminal endonuclease domain-containing protein n=1 Tax=Pseudolactococcus hodotermopsidis TaxID=2709157 RepID=A0A6A0BER1_9LACT|nr:hypothetical protein [Lactococcus hodotermopsidis]GFH42818.1 hypothetical protein Hs30E_13690 [Lactococcus hodotermopsidis]